MANPEVKLDVDSVAETSKESKVASNPASVSEPKVERVASAKCERFSLCDARRIWRRFFNTVASNPESKSKEDSTPDSPQASFLLKWKKIFLASCVFAVILDPLFLYIPMIDQDRSCFRVDNNLKITALVLRSLTDLFYIMDIAFQFYESESSSGFINKFRHESHSSALRYLRDLLQAIAKTLWKSRVLIDVLAIIPLPQVAILSFFSKMRVSSSLNISKVIMNFVVLMQYLPRVLRIYLSCIDLRKTPNEGTGDIKIWVKGVLNFFMYILAGHVLGAVWYFFAIQRMTDCWQNACERNGTVCDKRDFGCASLPTPDKALKVLNDSCFPVEKPDKSQFDFGIFSNLLQSEITNSTNHLQKFCNSFCWGLRNLSSLGSNLAPSTNTWENLFVTFISIIGLLLFIYLIGNLQTYMQLDVSRIAERRHKKRVEQKLEEKSEEIQRWLSKNGIPERLLTENELLIKKKVEQELEEDRDVNLESFHTITPSKLQDHIKRFSPLSRLKQAPEVHHMDGIVLEEICNHLLTKKYDNEYIVREGRSLDGMIFIVEGRVIVEKGNSSRGSQPGERELYGEKLLAWPSCPSFPAPESLPSATVSVKAIGNVEALVLPYGNMDDVGSRFRSHFNNRSRKFKEVVEQLANSPTPPRILTRGEVSRATKKFSKEMKIGGGGTGSSVYKGTLSDEKVVAIKVPSSSMSSSESDKFMNEVIVLSQTFHRNVVRLFGVCLEEKQPPIVVYEFVGNGTLDEHIHKTNGKGPLAFESRMRIAAEIADSLAYLHNLPSMSIIHRDVKSSNILLDDDYTAKLSDFTASRFVSEDKAAVLKLVKDTLEYTPPEYYKSITLTDKRDVYCFGVVLMELMTGQMMEEVELTKYSASSVNRRCLEQELVLDERYSEIVKEVADQIVKEVADQIVKEVAEEVADLAIACIKLKGEERPTMKEVATKLEELKTMLKANFTPSSK